MALKLRRGTDAERQLITPEAGEPLWIDNEALWIGDGSTVGGIKVTGGLANDLAAISIDALSDVDTTSSAPTNGQTLIWNTNKFAPGLPALTINDLTNVDVVSNPPSNGDSLVWDGASWVPGSPSFSPGGVINGYLDGDMEGSVFSDDSTKIIDGFGGGLVVGNVDNARTYTVDLQGGDIRIGGNNPNMITTIDAATTNLSLRTENASGEVISYRPLRLGGTSSGFSETSLTMYNANSSPALISMFAGANDDTAGYVGVFKARGTKTAPTAAQTGDSMGSYLGLGYNGFNYRAAGGLRIKASGAPDSNHVPADIELVTANPSTGVIESQFKVNTSGTATFSGMAQLAVYADTAARDAAATPAAGMVCFVTDGDGVGNPQFQGYTGSAWVALN